MKLLQTTAIAGLLVASGAASALELSGNVALTTDYVWRGASQTAGAPAIQGGFDADLGNGLYAGVWASNVDGGVEVDLYAGLNTSVAGLDLDIGVLHYAYPTSDNGTDFTEVYVGTTVALPLLGDVSISQSFGIDTGSDDTGGKNIGDYTAIGFGLGDHYGFAIAANLGYLNANDANVAGNENAQDATDWKVSASKSMFGVDLEIAYTDSDQSESEDTVALTISKSL
ncbi:MAG TPA: hypothetical protein EYQ65_06795 [Cycloclasticus sp.]|nr:hypothetical protein [Cycloclasticus sp.]